jgi:glycosyltransferase involved in cell wall biosynthesis
VSPKDAPQSADLTVVIPTYGKPETLPLVLRRLEAQTLPRDRFEVIVIDDGSPDDTSERLGALAASTPLTLRWLRQENRGVSATRNRGAREARAAILLLIQDDILAAPDLLERHLQGHRNHPEVTAVVVGRVTWPPEWKIDHFMEWLDNGGPQFRYHQVRGRTTVTYKHVYTCNVSFKTQALLDNPFDEQIVYGFEDIELAWRLQERGFSFHFDEQALGVLECGLDVREPDALDRDLAAHRFGGGLTRSIENAGEQQDQHRPGRNRILCNNALGGRLLALLVCLFGDFVGDP